MLAQERHAIILDMLRERKIIKISDIATQFGISNLTARRDLDILQDQNLVRRVHGGAILMDQDALLAGRSAESHTRPTQRAEIQTIGKLAASMIQSGEVVFLGIGTTVLEVARHMHHLTNITVLTNSLAVINELAGSGNTIYVLGGILDSNEHSISGRFAVDMLGEFCADWAFIGCGGVTAAHGLSDYYEPGAAVSRVMVKNAAKTVLVTSSHKFNSDALSIVCPISDIYMVVTDEGISAPCRDELNQLGVKLRMVQTTDEEENAER